MSNTKTCTCCQRPKDLNEFPLGKQSGHPLTTCKGCTALLTNEPKSTSEGHLCNRCGWRRPDEAFSFGRKGSTTPMTICRSCQGGSAKYKTMGQPSKALRKIQASWASTSEPIKAEQEEQLVTVARKLISELNARILQQSTAIQEDYQTIDSLKAIEEELSKQVRALKMELGYEQKKVQISQNSLRHLVEELRTSQAENAALRAALVRETSSATKLINASLGDAEDIETLKLTISHLMSSLSDKDFGFELVLDDLDKAYRVITGLEAQLAMAKSKAPLSKAPEPLSNDFLTTFLSLIGFTTSNGKGRKAS